MSYCAAVVNARAGSCMTLLRSALPSCNEQADRRLVLSVACLKEPQLPLQATMAREPAQQVQN